MDLSLGVMEEDEQDGEDAVEDGRETEQGFEEKNGTLRVGVAKNVVDEGVETINIVLLVSRIEGIACAT